MGDSTRERGDRAPDHAAMAAEARTIVDAATAAGLALRVVGGVGVWERLRGELRVAYEAARPSPRDIDLLAPPKSSGRVKDVFAPLAYAPDERLIAWHGDRRHRYFRLDEGGEPVLEVDVFIGKPPLCHEIPFSDRLGSPGPGMEPTDLLLQKLQIHEATEKDLTDGVYLIAAYELAEPDRADAISSERIARLTAGDWGFFHTATTNLARLDAAAAGLPSDSSVVARERIGRLAAAIEEAPKSRRWKLRARVGTKMRWYEDVEELVR